MASKFNAIRCEVLDQIVKNTCILDLSWDFIFLPDPVFAILFVKLRVLSHVLVNS